MSETKKVVIQDHTTFIDGAGRHRYLCNRHAADWVPILGVRLVCCHCGAPLVDPDAPPRRVRAWEPGIKAEPNDVLVRCTNTDDNRVGLFVVNEDGYHQEAGGLLFIGKKIDLCLYVDRAFDFTLGFEGRIEVER